MVHSLGVMVHVTNSGGKSPSSYGFGGREVRRPNARKRPDYVARVRTQNRALTRQIGIRRGALDEYGTPTADSASNRAELHRHTRAHRSGGPKTKTSRQPQHHASLTRRIGLLRARPGRPLAKIIGSGSKRPMAARAHIVTTRQQQKALLGHPPSGPTRLTRQFRRRRARAVRADRTGPSSASK